MNAHSSRSKFSRRNLVPLTAFFLLSLVFVFGLSAGTAQSDEKEEREVVEKIPKHLPIKVKVSEASNVTQREHEKILEKREHPNPVTDLINVKVKGVPVAFGRKISEGDEWLKGITVGVKNLSTEPIVYFELQIRLFGEKSDEEAIGKPPFIYPLTYGDYDYNDPSQLPTPSSPYQAIAPGQSVDIALTDEAYSSLIDTLSAAGYPLTLKHAELSVADVIFADGTRWYKSMLLQRDLNNPKKWHRIRGARKRLGGTNHSTPSTGNPVAGSNASFFFSHLQSRK